VTERIVIEVVVDDRESFPDAPGVGDLVDVVRGDLHWFDATITRIEEVTD
jgi:hypothetical protein